MAQMYWRFSIAAFSLAGAGLIFTVFFWFKFGIWKIIGELSGRSAKKSIARMRQKRENAVKFQKVQSILLIHTEEVI